MADQANKRKELEELRERARQIEKELAGEPGHWQATEYYTMYYATTGFTLLAILFSGPLNMGAPGIALANTIAFTSQSLVMIWLLNRKFPGLTQVGNTLLRVLLVALVGGGLVYLALKFLPLASMSLVMGILATGGVLGVTVLLTVPFILAEIKLLLKL